MKPADLTYRRMFFVCVQIFFFMLTISILTLFHNNYFVVWFFFVFQLTRESGERIHVCAPTFQSILCMGKKRVGNIAKFLWEHNSPRPERRGGKRQQQGYTDLKQQVIDHIQTFTCVSSHYGRSKTPHRKYLPSTLSVQRMWELFKEQYMGDMNVTYTFYYNIFMTQFNLGFGSPKTDVCSYCKGHETALKNEKKMRIREKYL